MILLDEDDDEIPAKKRRLRTDQVRALEQSFDLENRLEPDRKARLAHELGLQPRQVAVWFQNRRARWKAKQLERDFAALKSKYEALRLGFDSLRRDNGSLVEQVKALKAKLSEGGEKPRGACESESSAVDLFKVEEDWEEACGARGLFSLADEHGSALAWFSAEIAAGGGGW